MSFDFLLEERAAQLGREITIAVRKSRGRLYAQVKIGQSIAKEFNWAKGDKIRVGWGRDDNAGRAKKDDVLRECYQRGWKPRNDNESDAGALWAYGAATDEVQALFRRAA